MNSQELDVLLARLADVLPTPVAATRRSGSLPQPTPVAVDPTRLASLIDHTQLGATTTARQIETLCAEAKTHGFFSVCVPGASVSLASVLLHGTRTKVCTVVGFPLGNSTPASKAFEAREAARHGAGEVDMVLNIGALKARDYELVTQDIEAVVQAVPACLVKVILECALLERQEIVLACALAQGAGAHFVKTSTGFSTHGARAEHVALMREVVGPQIGVKASGGIRTKADALAMIEAGATRLGCSASVQIVTEASHDSDDSDAQGY